MAITLASVMIRTAPVVIGKPPVTAWNFFSILFRMIHVLVGNGSAPFLHKFHLFEFYYHDFFRAR
jgi:hypothetical protein